MNTIHGVIGYPIEIEPYCRHKRPTTLGLCDPSQCACGMYTTVHYHADDRTQCMGEKCPATIKTLEARIEVLERAVLELQYARDAADEVDSPE